MGNVPDVVAMLIPIAGIAFVTIAVWLGERRKEKESFQRCELLRKIADSQGDAAQRVLAVIRQQDYEAQIRRREGLKLGGLITLAAGIGLMIFLYMIETEEPVWVAGSIPILVGAALVAYVLFMAPKPEREANGL